MKVSVFLLLGMCLLTLDSEAQSSYVRRNALLVRDADAGNSSNTGDTQRTWFNNFYAGLSSLGNNLNADLAVTARTFAIELTMKGGEKKDLTFQLLNRASINFDSLKRLANNYLLSLNASPLTGRIDYPMFFTQNKVITLANHKTVFGARVIGDFRAVPFANAKSDKVKVGGSAHSFVSLFLFLPAKEKDDTGTVIDYGMIYFEPTIYAVLPTQDDLLQAVKPTKNTDTFSNRLICGIDFKLGYKSFKNAINDIGLTGFYTWQDVLGPRFRVGIAVKPQ